MRVTLGSLFFGLCLAWACKPAPSAQAPSGPVPITATVQGVSEAASWDHFADGSFAVHDAVKFRIVSPARLAGRRITVHVESGRLPPQSAFRTVGCRCAFTVDPERLESDVIYWGALDGLRVLSR